MTVTLSKSVAYAVIGPSVTGVVVSKVVAYAVVVGSSSSGGSTERKRAQVHIRYGERN